MTYIYEKSFNMCNHKTQLDKLLLIQLCTRTGLNLKQQNPGFTIRQLLCNKFDSIMQHNYTKKDVAAEKLAHALCPNSFLYFLGVNTNKSCHTIPLCSWACLTTFYFTIMVYLAQVQASKQHCNFVHHKEVMHTSALV